MAQLRMSSAVVSSLLLAGCGAGVGALGARCERGNSSLPQTVVTCAAGLTCCVGPPDTGGACEAPDGGTLCPPGTEPQ
jgi:hypothetical protein